MLQFDERPEERTGAQPAPRPPEVAEGFDPVDAAIGVITAPVLAMRYIAVARPWPIGLAIFVAIMLLNGFVGLTAPRAARETNLAAPSELLNMVEAMERLGDFVQSPRWVLLNALVVTPLLLLIWLVLVYYAARLLGGLGTFAGLLSTQCFAAVPNFLLAPLALIANIVRVPLLGGLLAFAFGIWTLVLSVIGIRESMAFSIGRAIAALLIPLAILLLLSCVLGIFAAAALVGSLTGQ